MIKFRCKNCGQKISVPEIHAGKKGKCPKCKNIVVVPKVEEAELVAGQAKPSISEIGSKDSILDSRLFDIPQESKTVGAQGSVSDKALDDLRKLQAGRVEPEPVPERRLPWLIDIFLYPISKAGLMTIGIIIGVPLVMGLLVFLLVAIMLVFPPMLVFVVLFGMIGWLMKILISLFVYWYFCECIRDSAGGGIRAPETMATTPGVGEVFWQFMKLVGCFIFFWGPLAVYVYSTGAAQRFVLMDNEPVGSAFSPSIAILLLAYAVFFFPMGLLSMVLFDSLAGLNPILIIGSIISTFFQYCGLILLFFAIGALCIISVTILPRFWLLNLFSNVVLLYMAMVYAYLLGRFYWRYQERLNWEV